MQLQNIFVNIIYIYKVHFIPKHLNIREHKTSRILNMQNNWKSLPM